MNILLIGSGGRECALAWKISESKFCSQLYIAPGNGGTDNYGQNVDISVNNFEEIAKFCVSNSIEMLVVGPEEPLVNGIKNYFNEKPELNKITVIGPDKNGALLEASKAYSKKFMQKYNIPTAAYKSFDSSQTNEAKQFLKTLDSPYVIKADGLAAGKGVIITTTIEEAIEAIDDILINKIFNEAGSKIVIEEFMNGVELSVFVLTDGENYIVLPEAKDYKRIGYNDTGLNTGGMGSVSPVPFANLALKSQIEEKIIKPTIQGLKTENIDYTGFIFFGLMIVDGIAKVIEYNARLGDPETQAIMPRIKTDLVELFNSVANKKLNQVNIEINDRTVANVVIASGGYPESFEKHKEIEIEPICKNQIVFHAATIKNSKSSLLTNGGRVISCCGIGEDLEEALLNAYNMAHKVKFEKMYYRADIGQDLLKLQNN